MDAEERPVILAVDDDPVLLNLTVAVLKRHYRVRPFTSGETALKYLAVQTPHLALLDCRMPGLSGPELFALLRDNPRTAGIPVIFLTGLDDEASEAALLDLGAAGVLRKPVKAGDLLALVLAKLSPPLAGGQELKRDQAAIPNS